MGRTTATATVTTTATATTTGGDGDDGDGSDDDDGDVDDDDGDGGGDDDDDDDVGHEENRAIGTRDGRRGASWRSDGGATGRGKILEGAFPLSPPAPAAAPVAGDCRCP